MKYADVRMRSLCYLTFLLLLFGQGDPAGAQSIPDSGVRVTTVQTDDHFEVVVENNNPYDITLTLTLSGENFRSPRGTSFQEVYRPDSRTVAMMVYPNEAGRSVSIRTDYEWFMGDVRARHNNAYVYALPFGRGMEFILGQGYDGEFSHSGKSRFALDFMMPVGTPVYAAREGVVINVKEDSNRGGPSRDFMDQSNYIVIRHDDGTLGEYAHFRQNGVLVEPGQRVRKGEQIGFSGNTGFSSGPHLHFMVTKVTSDGSSQSLPFRFRARQGLVTNPVEGEAYRSD